MISEAPHNKGKEHLMQGVTSQSPSAGEPEHNPVLAVHRHAVRQPGPQALVERGDELRQGLHAHDEPLNLPVQPTTPASERAGGGDVQVVQVYSIYSLYTIISILL